MNYKEYSLTGWSWRWYIVAFLKAASPSADESLTMITTTQVQIGKVASRGLKYSVDPIMGALGRISLV